MNSEKRQFFKYTPKRLENNQPNQQHILDTPEQREIHWENNLRTRKIGTKQQDLPERDQPLIVESETQNQEPALIIDQGENSTNDSNEKIIVSAANQEIIQHEPNADKQPLIEQNSYIPIRPQSFEVWSPPMVIQPLGYINQLPPIMPQYFPNPNPIQQQGIPLLVQQIIYPDNSRSQPILIPLTQLNLEQHFAYLLTLSQQFQAMTMTGQIPQ